MPTRYGGLAGDKNSHCFNNEKNEREKDDERRKEKVDVNRKLLYPGAYWGPIDRKSVV